MAIQNAIASLAVTDLTHSVKWYRELFGREPDSRPTSELAQWTFPQGGQLQVYRLPERAGRGSVTLAVDDIKAHAGQLKERGIAASKPSGNANDEVIMIKDPDGNSIALAQANDQSTL